MSSPSPNMGRSSGPQMSNQGWTPTPDPAQGPASSPPPAYPRAAPARRGGWLPTTAMWIGFVALALGWVSTGILGVIAGIVAVVLGILGLSLRASRRSRAIVALVFGAIAIFGWAAFYLFILAYAPSMLGKV